MMQAGTSLIASHKAAPMVQLAGSCVIQMRSARDLLADKQLAAAWDDLACDTSEPNAFAERWYMEAALQALPSDDVQMAVVWDGALIGMMPLQRQARYAGLPVAHVQNWLNHNAFLGTPLLRKGHEQNFWATLFESLDQESHGYFLHISGITCTGPAADALASACRLQQRRFALVQQEERALLEHGLSPMAYLETHVRGKKRKELRRQHKRLAEEGRLLFDRAEGSEALDRWINEFLALEMRGWKGANRSALACEDATATLFREALFGAASAGRLERLQLRLDDRPIAMLANFHTPPGAFSFKTAFDEDYARFSPGVLLQLENLALLERDGLDWCDSCAAADHPMIDSIWAGRRKVGRYSVAIGGPAKRAGFAALLAAEKAKARLKGRIIE